MPNEGWSQLGDRYLGWRCALILQLGYSEPSSPEESDFATVAGSAAGHLSPLADRWNAVSHLQSTIELPSLQGFQQSLAEVSPLHATLCFTSPSRSYGCRLWEWGIIVE